MMTRRSLPHSKKNSLHSLPIHAASEGQPQRHGSMPKVNSRNSSAYKYISRGTSRNQKTNYSSNNKSIRLSDLMAAMYPGLKIGHKNCVEKAVFVPKTMGWLWNTEDTATGVPFPRGWRPGAVALGVRRRVGRSRLMSEPLTTPAGLKGKKMKKKPGRGDTSGKTSKAAKSGVSSIAIDVPPTLCIQKEHGVYHVKMRPIKKGGEDENTEEEQPVQFKIADSVSSRSGQTQSTSSSLKIEYLCTGALRKPIKKPELAEMGTQWETSDFEKTEKIPEEIVTEEKKVPKKGKKKISTDKSEAKGTGKEETKETGKEETKSTGKEDTKPAGKVETKQAGKVETKGTGKEETKGTGKEETKGTGKEEVKGTGKVETKGTGKEEVKGGVKEDGKGINKEEKKK